MPCFWKKTYFTRSEAETQATVATERAGDIVEVYYCEDHGGFHLGHPKKKKKLKKKK